MIGIKGFFFLTKQFIKKDPYYFLLSILLDQSQALVRPQSQISEGGSIVPVCDQNIGIFPSPGAGLQGLLHW